MALNSRKHTVPAGADQSVSRATIFETFGNSIHDVIPVANATERAQVISGLTAAGMGPSAAVPVLVSRADAPGLHRIEYTFDGTIWIPATGTLAFPDKATAEAWATANAALLSLGDEAIIAGVRAPWMGTEWGYWPPMTLSAASGWTAETSEAGRPQIMREGYLATFWGRLFGGTPGSPAATLPVWARPSRNLRVLISDNTGAFSLTNWAQIDSGGSLRLNTWTGGTSFCSWPVR